MRTPQPTASPFLSMAPRRASRLVIAVRRVWAFLGDLFFIQWAINSRHRCDCPNRHEINHSCRERIYGICGDCAETKRGAIQPLSYAGDRCWTCSSRAVTERTIIRPPSVVRRTCKRCGHAIWNADGICCGLDPEEK